ncbi:ankyrin [Trypanosoma rangeli]|uniref:Ankyrin n=1 Tax=Trypanosoma rangeli TaxID=5698 RepID=A0A3R7RA24_TRYRA|nr:ankyrin [Trypanosoma rangeli]RNE98605.1 ankyrin [Trypanosoma rangeli]|eukprot:RNE98605.1 ankyrin [Trypanosoma rangeli]
MDHSVFGFIEREDSAAIEREFSQENINFVNADGYTPLYYASMKKNVGTRTVEQLLSLGAEVDMKGFDDETPLYIACFNGKIKVVLLLLENGADVNAKNGRDDETPLHVAARIGNCALIALLVERGANLDAQNFRGETPLYLAAKAGFHNAVYQLMNAGADVNIYDVDGKDPLYVASERRLKHVVILLKNSLQDLVIAKAMADKELQLRPPSIKSTELILEEAEKDAAAGRPIHHAFFLSKSVKEAKPLEIVQITVPRPKAGPRNPFAAPPSGPCRSLEEVGYDEPPALPPSFMDQTPAIPERIGGTSMRIGTGVKTMGAEPPRISCVPGDCMEFSMPQQM